MINYIETIPTQAFTEKELLEIAAEKMLTEYNKEQAIKGKERLFMRYATLKVQKTNNHYLISIEFDFTKILEKASTDLSQKPIDPIEMQRKILGGAE
jgi:hypothetical protein